MKKLEHLIIGLDFDGTVVTHEFPKVGRDIDNCVKTLKRIVDAGSRLVLNTMRSNHTKPPTSTDPDIHCKAGNYLDDAVKWFKERDIPLYGIQRNPEQDSWTSSPKVYAHLYIDDAALGCPLIETDVRPFVDWFAVEKYLFKD
jgi:hypothetical protein